MSLHSPVHVLLSGIPQHLLNLNSIYLPQESWTQQMTKETSDLRIKLGD